MFSRRIRVYNDCSKRSINAKFSIVFPLTGLVLNGEDFGVIEPKQHKDILFRAIVTSNFPYCTQELIFDVGENRTLRVTLDDILTCKGIRLIEDQNGIVVQIIAGNCFERIGIVWMLKDFAKGCGQKIKKFEMKLLSRRHNEQSSHVTNWAVLRETLLAQRGPA